MDEAFAFTATTRDAIGAKRLESLSLGDVTGTPSSVTEGAA
jgi:hypothetical protein